MAIAVGAENALETRGVLPEAWGNEGTGLGGADTLAGAGLWENDVPEIDARRREGNTYKAVLVLLAQGSDAAFHGFGSHLIENADGLAGQQR